MAEYISDQTESTTAPAGGFFVYETSTDTYKISRQNLIGQMDANTSNIANNTANIVANTGNIANNTANIATNTSVINAIAKDTIMRGLRFDGTSQYMNLGQVPLLNSEDSYIRVLFKASSWENSKSPFGYNNNVSVSNDRLYMIRNSINEEGYNLQSATQTTITPSEYPNPEQYQEFLIDVQEWNGGISPTLTVSIGGSKIVGMTNRPFTPQATSTLDFLIGARNNNGTTDAFTTMDFFSFESFNGVTKKEVNYKNNWDGATLVNEPSLIYSIDGGGSWE